MEISDFEEITGIILTEAQAEQFNIMLNRAQRRLQKNLGWELEPSDEYEEIGQLLSPCAFVNQRTFDANKMKKSMKEPDRVNNSWRLFPYRDVNTNMRIDPCTEVYNAKLVIPLIKGGTEFVTIHNFLYYVPIFGRAIDGQQYINYLTKIKDDFPCCNKWITHSPLLAVDAEWIEGVWPSDLMEVLADFIVYEYQNKPSLSADSGRPLRSISQSVDGHSVSKTYIDSDRLIYSNPLEKDGVKDVLMGYIGPYSPLYKERRIY